MIGKEAFLLIILYLLATVCFGQEHKTIKAVRLNGEQPDIDGKLSEKVWESANWSGSFIQREPYDNQPPSQQTAVKVLYDDNNLYVAIRAYDTEPEKIEKRLSRRDNFEGDWVAIAIDSYNDDLTAFSFSANAAGVKSDGMVSNDSDWDDTWNPVYYVKTAVDELGWIAEFRVPYNQLRFADIESHVWGFQVMRYIFRKEEMSLWQPVARESSRWVSLFGDLEGITNINPKKEVEIVPYVMGNLETQKKEDDSPFISGKTWGFNAGVDGKVAVTSDLTLNYTINPDFGQVEADPSEVNLTAYETFFEEKRPFFIEGNNIYDFPLSGGGGPTGRDNLFYTRRIGRRPQYAPDLEDGQYSSVIDFTRILAALKLSGKTRNGWSVGIMEALTNKEEMEFEDNGYRTTRDAEPTTNYFNTRIQKDFYRGNRVVGGMVTATNRFLDDTTVNFLPSSAYTWGADFRNYWDEKAYYFAAKLAFSYVNGSTEAITELQESPRRFYQRPDATHLHLDTTLTSLFGNGGSVEGGKIGKGNWRYGGRVSWRSPGLELNDMGYIRTADMIHQTAWLRYEIFTPFSIFRLLNVGLAQWTGWDYSATNLWSGIRLGGNAQFTNYFTIGTGIRREFEEINRAELFGGPAIKYPGSWETWLNLSTDGRKKLVGRASGEYEWGDYAYKNSWELGFGLTYRPLTALQLSVEPEFQYTYEDARFIEDIEKEDGTHYIMGSLVRNQAVLNIRINVYLTPDLSIQFWGQPFLFSGDYDNFKRVISPQHSDYFQQFYQFTDDEIIYDQYANSYLVCESGFDESGAGCTTDNPDYSFENPDFSFHEFRSNLVFRWEYIPGSFLFLVWSQNRVGDDSYGSFHLDRHFGSLLDSQSINVFLIKFSYRFSF